MRLFHGTNQDIEAIDLTKGLPYKDFGQGFYLTPDKITAERIAMKPFSLSLSSSNPIRLLLNA